MKKNPQQQKIEFVYFKKADSHVCIYVFLGLNSTRTFLTTNLLLLTIYYKDRLICKYICIGLLVLQGAGSGSSEG
jgi:hypothetical protein